MSTSRLAFHEDYLTTPNLTSAFPCIAFFDPLDFGKALQKSEEVRNHIILVLEMKRLFTREKTS